MSIRLILLCGLMSMLVGCASTIDNPAEKYKNYSAEQLFYTGVNSLSTKHYIDAAEQFEALDARYPFGKYADKEQLYIIYAYYKQSKYPEALAATDRFIHLHPDSKHVDYAYFMQAELNYQQNLGVFERYFPSDMAQRDLQPARKSYLEFMSLIVDYPKSKYVPNSVKYAIYLRNLMAERQVKVAQFYFDRKAYIAAADRANNVIMHYQGAPAMQQALMLAIDSYKALHLDSLAQMYQRVLDLNYPANLPDSK